MNAEIYLLADRVIQAAIKKKTRLAFAESCTGGLIAAALTSIAGASAVFEGSAVTYSNAAKENILGVDGAVLHRFGAVSAECAEQMVIGARRIYRSNVAVSVTGIAGPGGGTPQKPVGTVWLGYANEQDIRSCTRYFGGDREQIRLATVKEVLSLLVKELS